MDWFEIYPKMLQVVDKEMGGITPEGKEEFNRMFYYAFHDWYVTEIENYRVLCHNEFVE